MQEIGIRMALGACRRDVLWLVVRQGMAPVLVIVVGAAGAPALTRFLAAMPYRVRPTDPATFAAASLGLACIALLAAYLQHGARLRAMRSRRSDTSEDTTSRRAS